MNLLLLYVIYNNMAFQLELIIIIASKYWNTVSMAATGLSSTDKELSELKIVPPMLCLIFFKINFPNSLLVPLNSSTSISGMLILSSLMVGMRIKYSTLYIIYLWSDRGWNATYSPHIRLYCMKNIPECPEYWGSSILKPLDLTSLFLC